MKEVFVDIFGKPMGIVLFQLLDATQFTIYLTMIAFIGGGLVAAVIAFLRIAPRKSLVAAASGYIWLFQSVPLLMLLFLLGLGVPRLLGVNVDPWTAAAIALTLFTSAYLADVWRGAIQAVPTGQWEGGYAIGLSFAGNLSRVILPQAIRIAVGPTIGFLVQIVKGTSLAYIIGFQDVMSMGKRWANAPVEGTEPFIVFPLMAFIYFCLCYPLSLWSTWWEGRSARGHRAPSRRRRSKVNVQAA